MKHNREFEIAWQGLKPGVHVYQYELDDKFLDEKQAERDFRDLDAQITLKFDKKNDFFLCHFDIDGSVTVPCDRCGDDFKMRLWDEFDLVIKLTGGEGNDEIDEDADVVFIPRSETVIDISNWLYEFVMLSVPLQRVHPEKADGSSGCNPEALKLLDQLSEPDEAPKNDIWKGLDALKDNNKRKSNKN
jgi:Predicted metal-binding, possibly nucleic acid-binding protein